MRRQLTVSLLAVAASGLGVLPAAAHGDLAVADGAVIVASGGEAVFPAEVHYHRLVGRVAAAPVVAVGVFEGAKAAPGRESR